MFPAVMITFAIFPITGNDSIDFWQVYYNQKMIREFKDFGKNELKFKLDSLKGKDSITVKYFRDTPCPDCVTHLSVEDGKHRVLVASEGKGTFNPVSFSVNKLIELHQQGYSYFEIFYSEGEVRSKADRLLLFRILLI